MRTVAQRFRVQHVGQLGQFGDGDPAAHRVDRAQHRDSGGQEAQQAVVPEHLHPRLQHGGAAGRGGP